jgi:general secretion pathway protein J
LKNTRRRSSRKGFTPHGNDDGFTLIELLIALVLLVLLSAALYGTFFSVVRGNDAVRERGEPLRDVRVTLEMLRRELSSAYFIKDKERFQFVVEDRDVFGKPASVLTFSTFTVPRRGKIPSSDIMEARYAPVEKEGDRIILSRRTRDIFLDVNPVSYPLTGPIEGFLVECYDGQSWVRSWDTALNGKLPNAIRITIRLPGGENPTPLTAVVIPRLAAS